MRLNFACVEVCFGALDICKPVDKVDFLDCRMNLQFDKNFVGPVSGLEEGKG